MKHPATLALVVLVALGTACARKPAPPRVYGEGIAGLEALASDLARASAAAGTALASGLVVPDPEALFHDHYAPDVADRLLAEYRARPPSPAALAELLRKQRENGLTVLHVERFDRVADPLATGYQEIALKQQTKLLPLYSVRATHPDDPKRSEHLYNFVYTAGAWRYAGPMKAIKETMMNDPRLDALASMRARDRQIHLNQEQR